MVRTERAGHFFKPEDIPDTKIHTDEMEWKVGGRGCGCAHAKKAELTLAVVPGSRRPAAVLERPGRPRPAH